MPKKVSQGYFLNRIFTSFLKYSLWASKVGYLLKEDSRKGEKKAYFNDVLTLRGQSYLFIFI